MTETEQPFVDEWPLYHEAYSKFPVLADIEAARIRLARKFNRALPKDVQTTLGAVPHTSSCFSPNTKVRPCVRGGSWARR